MMKFQNEAGLMNFVCVVFELCDKMLTLSSMENLIVPCNLQNSVRECTHYKLDGVGGHQLSVGLTKTCIAITVPRT